MDKDVENVVNNSDPRSEEARLALWDHLKKKIDNVEYDISYNGVYCGEDGAISLQDTIVMSIGSVTLHISQDCIRARGLPICWDEDDVAKTNAIVRNRILVQSYRQLHKMSQFTTRTALPNYAADPLRQYVSAPSASSSRPGAVQQELFSEARPDWAWGLNGKL